MGVDLSTGDRTVISSDSVGTGPLDGFGFLAIVEENDRIIVLDSGSAVLSVHPETGDRELLTGESGAVSRGSGPILDDGSGPIVVDNQRGRVLLFTQGPRINNMLVSVGKELLQHRSIWISCNIQGGRRINNGATTTI